MRDDIHGVERAPKAYADFLIRVGGRNPFDEPNYRLIWAANRYETIGGEWTDWPEGASVAERGGMVADEYGNVSQSDVKPLRVVTELRKTQKYPICDCQKKVQYGYCPVCDGIWGWLLEKWYPAHFFGSRDAWYGMGMDNPNGEEWVVEANQALAAFYRDKGIPKLGPYPEQGDYEKVSMSMRQLPPFDSLLSVIQRINRNIVGKSGTPQQRIAKKVYESDMRIEADKEKKKELMKLKIRDRMSAYRGSSLESGRLREELAKRAGLREHCGN